MKLAIVGSRCYTDRLKIKEVIDQVPEDTIIVSGGARGVDTIAQELATERGLKVEVYKPDWDKYGNSAGIIRNGEIITNCDTLIAFWDGKSSGTKNSIERAIRADHIKKVLIFKVNND